MTHKEQLYEAIKAEFKILNHLYNKIPEGKMEFKPGDEMRTIHQLLKYLTWSGAASLKGFIEGDENSPNFEIYSELSEANKDFKPENFIEYLDRELELIKTLFEKFDDKGLLEKKIMTPFGKKVSLGEGIINTTVKHMNAYKMQLYLYLKILGVKLDTGDCWIGEEEDGDE